MTWQVNSEKFGHLVFETPTVEHLPRVKWFYLEFISAPYMTYHPWSQWAFPKATAIQVDGSEIPTGQAPDSLDSEKKTLVSPMGFQLPFPQLVSLPSCLV